MKISYYYDEGRGLCCDRCGRDIKHVYVVTDETTGLQQKVGCECINKVMAISDYGLNQLKKDLKHLKGQQAKLDEMKSKTLDQLVDDADGNLGMIEMSKSEKDACNWEQTWRPRTVEEYKDQMVFTMWVLDDRIKWETEEMCKRYKNIRLKGVC